MKVSIVIASCDRPYMLRDMLDSFQASTNWIRGDLDVEMVFVIDDDMKTLQVVREAVVYEGQIVDYSNSRRGALAAWNRGLQLSTGDIIVPAGDDQKFHANWLDFALESHKEKLSGYGVVGMNDLAYDGNKQLATMYMMDRQFIKDHLGGVLCPPIYKYYCVDSEINAKAKSLGRFYWDERAKVEHLHSAHGKRPVDAHDRERLENNYAEIDKKTFEERRAQGFPITWQPLI